MTRVGFSFFRVGLIAGNTLRDALRQRVLALLVLLAAALVVAVQWLRDLNFGSSELKFLADFGLGALAFFGAVLAIVATAQLFFSEIELRTVHTLLAKPVRRSEFLLGKFGGVVVVLGAYCVLMCGFVAAVLWVRETGLMRQFPDAFAQGRTVDYTALAAAGFAQWLKLDLLAALTLLIASFARTQIFASVTGFLILVICHLQSFAQAAAARTDSMATRVFAGGIALLFPDFQIFDLADWVTNPRGETWTRVAELSAYATGYTAVVLALTALSFKKREL